MHRAVHRQRHRRWWTRSCRACCTCTQHAGCGGGAVVTEMGEGREGSMCFMLTNMRAPLVVAAVSWRGRSTGPNPVQRAGRDDAATLATRRVCVAGQCPPHHPIAPCRPFACVCVCLARPLEPAVLAPRRHYASFLAKWGPPSCPHATPCWPVGEWCMPSYPHARCLAPSSPASRRVTVCTTSCQTPRSSTLSGECPPCQVQSCS